MPTLSELLRARLDEISIPRDGQNYTVEEYFGLAPEQRGDDEADVIDMRLTRALLGFLGYVEGDWEYNRNNAGGRPDFLVAPDGRIAFFIEDKRTSSTLELSQHKDQIGRYAESITPLGLAFNGRQVVAVRLRAGRISPILRVDLLLAAGLHPGGQLPLDPDAEEVSLGVLVELFQKSRFVNLGTRIRGLTCTVEEWLAQAADINERIDAFGENAARLIVRLSRVALAALLEHLEREAQHAREFASLQERAAEILRALPNNPDIIGRFGTEGNSIVASIGRLSDSRLRAFAEHLPLRARNRFIDQVRSIDSDAKRLDIEYEESLEVARRYHNWLMLERRFEASVGEKEESEGEAEKLRRWRFARQCAYVTFLRVLLVRILEDKDLIPQRVITDGGLDLWLQIVRPRFAPHLGDLSSAPLLELALGQAEAVAGGIHSRTIYDWFVADDHSIVDILEVLHPYTFGAIATDVIGYTYQRFLEETEQHRLGHYLTPPAVIDHILDSAEYRVNNLEILGREVFDPACGSGSFLVHAAVRYRAALNQAYGGNTLGAARAFVEALQQHFIGFDINPFSCYLARINLLVQGLSDVALLRRANEPSVITDLRIYNADSLDFATVGQGQEGMTALVSDPIQRFKIERARQIQYVFANPPYINVKLENIYLSDIQNLPFFENWLHGDANTYLLFIRVALHFLAPGGIMAFIVPSTVLGDQQAEKLRRHTLQDGLRLVSITRFYAERVLFKPVEQATSVLVIKNDVEDVDVVIKGGGLTGTHEEAVADVATRPVIQVPARDLRVWLSRTAIPNRGAVVPPPEHNWLLIWPIMPERESFYRAWNVICDSSGMTVQALFQQLNVPLDGVFKQGDVNTTHVSPFHVAGDLDGAIPLYKGEEIDHLIPLTYRPSRGPSRRTPFVSPEAQGGQRTAQQRGALAKLRAIADMHEAEYGFVLHEVAKFRVPRRIAGTSFIRGANHPPMVFPHTVWVASPLTEELSLGLLGLLTSAVLNFTYHFCSTNNHVLLNLLACLPLPADTSEHIPRIAALTRNSLGIGQELLRAYEGAGVNRGRALRTGTAEIDPARLLEITRLPRISANTWVRRNWLRLPEGDIALTRFTVATLHRRGLLNLAEQDSITEVLSRWIVAYGHLKWVQFSELEMPDNPREFLRCLHAVERNVAQCQEARRQSIAAIDDAVFHLFRLDAEICETIAVGPPWLAGQSAEAEEEEEEAQA